MGSCEQNTDRIIDGLTGNLAGPEQAALDHHLATCDACRRESEALRDLWETLAAVPIPASPSTPAPAEPTVGSRGRRRASLAAAASLLLGLLGGYLAGSAGGEPGGTTVREGEYLLLLRQPGPTLGVGVPPESALVREYGAWAGELADRRALLLGERLDDNDIALLTPNGVESTGREMAPYISGFFLLQADTFDEATAIAATMPHLRYGGSVEVRAVARE